MAGPVCGGVAECGAVRYDGGVVLSCALLCDGDLVLNGMFLHSPIYCLITCTNSNVFNY